jgi:hypothetical protein
LLAAAGNALAQTGPCDPLWSTAVGQPGANSTVWSLATAQAPSAIGPGVYVGGQFSTAGGVAAKNIARWNGTAFSALGSGTNDGSVVYTIAISESEPAVYAGGGFSGMGGVPGTRGIASWNGASWSSVGGGMTQSNTGLRALAFYVGDLYAGGFLNEIGGATTHKLARWNGAAWSALPGDPLGSTDSVLALTIYKNSDGAALYVGGAFASAGGNTFAANIFRWDGATLSPLGRGTNGEVDALAVFNGELYVGGYFNQVFQSDGTAVTASKIARWNGTAWSPVGAGMVSGTGYFVWAMNAFDDGAGPALFVGGQFNLASPGAASNIARWDGAAWTALGATFPLNGQVKALAPFDHDGRSQLLVGGTFTTVQSVSSARIAAWRSGRPLGPGEASTDPSVVCAGGATILTATPAGSAGIDWHAGTCDGPIVGSGTMLTVVPPSSTTYFARSRDGLSGCESSACVSVDVSVLPGGSADVDGNGTVDGRDIAAFLNALLNHNDDPPTAGYCAADMNGDGDVDMADVPLFWNAVLE